MTHDIDDLLRTALHRNAEDAPASIDLDLVRARARTLTRHRRVVAGVAAATLVVGSAVAAGALVQRRAEPAPGITVPLPPAPATTPWAATVADVHDPGHPPEERVSVAADGVTTAVDQANAAVFIAGWAGTDRRTLIYGYTQDDVFDQTLRTAVLDGSGRLVDGPRDLTLPGGARAVGRAFVTADGRLVVASLDAAVGDTALYRFSADLASASVTALPPGNEVIEATGEVAILETRFTTTAASNASPRDITLVSSGGDRHFTLPACPGGYWVRPSAGEAIAVVWCPSGSTVRTVPLTGVTPGASSPPSTQTSTVPGEGELRTSWITESGNVVVTRTPASSGVLQPGLSTTVEWDPRTRLWQPVDVVLDVEYVDGYVVASTWRGTTDGTTRTALTTVTDPQVDLGTTEGDFAVRPSLSP